MRRTTAIAAIVFAFAFGIRGAARHDGPHVGPDGEVFNVGKNRDVKIGMDVGIGDVLVKKGKYLFEHRIEGDSHLLVLTGLETKNGADHEVVRGDRLESASGDRSDARQARSNGMRRVDVRDELPCPPLARLVRLGQ